MEPRDYVEALRREGAALADAARGRLELVVPSCPEWTVAELVGHVGRVHDFWCQIVSRRLDDPEQAGPPDIPSDPGLVDWFREGVERVAAVLEGADPATPVWTWATQRDVAFIQRRMAQETAVHRWDAEAAAGRPRPLEPGLAVDGVDEFFEFMLPLRAGEPGGEGETVHLHATDAPGEWTVEVGRAGVSVSRAHGKGDAAVRAPASDLLLLLWRRIPPDGLEVFGDEGALSRFLARPRL